MSDASKPTIWTGAAATASVLSQLDMAAPVSGAPAAKKRAARLRARIDRDLASFATRSTAESLRKRVK
jgi:hypothetical protein